MDISFIIIGGVFVIVLIHIRLLRGPLLLEEKAGCLEAREGEKRPADVIGAAP